MRTSAKYEKLGKYWSYCTRNCAITNAYWIQNWGNVCKQVSKLAGWLAGMLACLLAHIPPVLSAQ